jgi:hypothetical protein
MPPKNRMQAAPFRRMRLVEIMDRLANEKMIRHDDPIVSSMARVLPLIQNPKRTKNATADLAVSVANMQHYKALERQRHAQEVQPIDKGLELEMEMESLNPSPKPTPKHKSRARPKRAKQSKRKRVSGLFSPRRTREHEVPVLKVYQ